MKKQNIITVAEAAAILKTGVNQTTISRIKLGRTWRSA
jgi:hypothetical protein